jgi:hypothetical protein
MTSYQKLKAERDGYKEQVRRLRLDVLALVVGILRDGTHEWRSCACSECVAMRRAHGVRRAAPAQQALRGVG